MMFPGTPARGTKSPVHLSQNFELFQSRVNTAAQSFFHVVLNVKDVFDY